MLRSGMAGRLSDATRPALVVRIGGEDSLVKSRPVSIGSDNRNASEDIYARAPRILTQESNFFFKFSKEIASRTMAPSPSTGEVGVKVIRLRPAHTSIAWPLDPLNPWPSPLTGRGDLQTAARPRRRCRRRWSRPTGRSRRAGRCRCPARRTRSRVRR